ncbi:MAG TPA: isocitrate lyase/phosphoenolpyruvate mutase family protein [Streptosporangiaceae bacterium]|nr:isocitrate lyase/phosphoenolpyruvate mutase family protein [Streptosporangiaceae bacterium]
MSALTAAARRFRAAHHGPQPLVLPNVWDCASARVFAGAGFGALATSSGAVAATLGYADGQHTQDHLRQLAAPARHRGPGRHRPCPPGGGPRPGPFVTNALAGLLRLSHPGVRAD